MAEQRAIRVLFAGTTLVVGGAERMFAHLVQGLKRDPFAVEVLVLRAPGPIGEELSRGGTRVHSRLTGESRWDPWLLPRLRRFLLRGRFDAIYFLDHAHAVFYLTLASLRTGVRVRVMPVHTTGQWGGRPSLKRPIRLVQGRLDRIIAIAEAQRAYLINKEGVPPQKLVVIPNGIPLQSPSKESRRRRRAEVRDELGIPPGRPVIGITAVLRPEKNHELLLASLARLRTDLPEAEVWIVGDGPRREFLLQEADRLGLRVWSAADAAAKSSAPAPSIRFFGQRDDARRLMAACDVAVLCSHPSVETLPLSLIEAMDAGLPVVATRVGALEEMVEEERSGFLVAPGDEAALAERTLRVLREPSLREAMGERGQAIARERYSLEGMVETTARVLIELAREKGVRGAV